MKNLLLTATIASAFFATSLSTQAQEITEFNVEPGACANVFADWNYTNADRVVLQRRTVITRGASSNFLTIYTGGNTAFIDRNVQANTQYVYRIQACQGATCSGYWSASTFTNCQ